MNGPRVWLERLERILGPDGLLVDSAARRVYARDASHLSLGRPLAVALPATVAQLEQVVTVCVEAGVPLVARGSGTGLSGGAVPPDGALVLGTGRLTHQGTIDPQTASVRVQSGVLNEQVSLRAAPAGLHFAPDPSSQAAASIGGNIAENAGGPHCLRHGVTLHHLRRLQWVGADGRTHRTGSGATGERGLDLVSLLCGSEGTLGIVTTADLGLVPDPPALVTLLAFFPTLAGATGAVVRLLGQGLLPVAVEMVDQAMLRAVEAAFGFGFPTDVEAALIAEFSGVGAEVDEDGAAAESVLRAAGAREVRRTADAQERIELWKCRKKAFGAVGRLAPNYVTMDVVVPLGELPSLVQEILQIKDRQGVEIATAFHAGDGNLHPGVHYDDRDPEAERKAHAAADEIIAAALERGGSVTGEHGVGIEKLHVLPWQLDAVSARLQAEIKRVFDPRLLLNPGKLLPDPDAEFAAPKPIADAVDFRWQSLTVTAPAATRLSRIQAEAMQRGFWLPLGVPGTGTRFGWAYDPTLGELLDHLTAGPALFGAGTSRDVLLESWTETGAGEILHSGAPVFKNVAGFDLTRMLCGSGGVFARHLAATFALRPCPEQARMLRLESTGTDQGDLTALWTWLAGRSGRPTTTQVVVDPDSGVFVLCAGRDRAWDLAGVAGELEAILAPCGWRVAADLSLPFAQAGTWLTTGHLPAWILAAADWTGWAPRPQQRAGAVPAGQPFLRQCGPDGVWVAKAVPAPSGWRTDSLIRADSVSPPPPPAPEVPRDLLRAMKKVFDPDGRLPTPAWLQTGRADHV